MPEVNGSIAAARLQTTFREVVRMVARGEITGRQVEQRGIANGELQMVWMFDSESIDRWLADLKARSPKSLPMKVKGSVRGAFRNKRGSKI